MKRWVVTLFAVVGVLSLVPSAAAGGAASWKGTGDRSIRLVDSVTAPFDPMLTRAVGLWNDSPVIQMRQVAGPTGAASRRSCSVEINTIRVCDYDHGPRGWAGMASIWQDGTGHIAKVKVRFNTYYVRTDHDRRVVTCHELGHALGLGHRKQRVKTSCLTPRLSVGEVPDATDMQHVLELHSGLRDGTQHAVSAAEAEWTTRDGAFDVFHFAIRRGGLA